MTEKNYRTRWIGDLSALDAETWNALVRADGGGDPFLRHEFLQALHATGCAAPATGWTPRFFTLWEADRLAGAVPLYEKAHSYGEYVFDWAWAEAHERYGLAYYPKWLAAVPFTPVAGSRLIAPDDATRAMLARRLVEAAVQASAAGTTTAGSPSVPSSLHLLFAPAPQIEALRAAGCAVRQGVQFHWHNRGYASFDDFLAHLAQAKRKKIRAERRQVAQAGVVLERRIGADITAADWQFFYRCYRATYAAHRSTPYLDLAFFLRLGAALPEHVVLITARRDGQPVAASLGVFDTAARGEETASAVGCGRLYGRYWGALEHVACLHFECCYYQMIEFAIERRLAVFEGGAQGAHKLARGLDPVPTQSAHWIADVPLRAAIERFLARETAAVEDTFDELRDHRAFRAANAVGTLPPDV